MLQDDKVNHETKSNGYNTLLSSSTSYLLHLEIIILVTI